MKKLFAILMVIIILCCVFCACEDTVSTNEDGDSLSSISGNQSSGESNSVICTHSKTTIKNKTEASCTENGYSGDTYCNDCDEVIERGYLVKASGHDTEIRNKKSATSAATGYTGDTYCKICGTKTETGKVTPKIESNTQQQTNSKTVYITATGKKYHSTKHCTGLNNAKAIYDSTLSKAQSSGLTPCSKCY